ncbi:MAG TPA: hypothetical protein VG148_10830 [Pyrinomonadaceae bacterium]|nr:hypothetical protein [Pyrinomonadaceae bacterium]
MARFQPKRSLRSLSPAGVLRFILPLWLLCTALASESRAQNWDFETGDLRGWTATGTAFNNQPTFGDNVAARGAGVRSGHEGNYWVGTYEDRRTSALPAGQAQGDGPTGTLVSAEFEITRTHLSFLIGGGLDFNRLRVELLVRIRPGDPPPPAVVALLGIGERVTLPGGEYFVGVHATGRNSEAMRREVWDVSVYRGRRARIRIKDDSSHPWGHINADDFRLVGGSPTTRIHVTDAAGNSAEGAEVYLNGVRAGATDASGNLTLGALSTAHDLVARKLVFESRSPRANHSAGSSQNWNFRVYNTSARVNNDGTVTAHPVTNPSAVQELRLSTSNALVGLHLVAAVEWDAAAGELSGLRDKFLAASQFLYNATDGQFFIEQVEIVDDAALWDDADYRVHANWSLRASAAGDGFRGGGWMRMARDNVFDVFVHEFGHYGFDLRDEYRDGATPGTLNPDERCTRSIDAANCMAGTDSAIADFGTFQPKASCIMWVQSCTSKLCSNRPENPHARGTRQGDTNCWSRIADKFRDRERERSFLVRWVLQTPDSRGAVVGTLPDLISGWRPRVAIDNRPRANLCQPFEVTVTEASDDRLLGGVEVWNRTFYDQNILLGKTTQDDPNTPENEAGRMTVVGAHIGDRLSAGGEPFIVGECDRAAALDRPGDAAPGGPRRASLRPASRGPAWLVPAAVFGPPPPAQRDGARVIKAAPFELRVSFEPTATAGQALVRARAGAELRGAPRAEFSLTGSTKTEVVRMRFDAATRTYVGLVNQLPPDAQGSVQVVAVDAAGRSVTRLAAVSLSPVLPDRETELFSADGQLSLTIPAGALPRGARVAVGPSASPPPPAGGGAEILSGPFSVAASTGGRLNRPAVLRFQLAPPGGKGWAAAAFHPKSFEALRYDPAAMRWESVGGTLVEGVEVVTLPIVELGSYVLTARRLTAPAAQKFAVTAVSLLASPSRYQGSCPAKINFDGVIEANGPGTVRYTFVRSDGATGPTQTLVFKSAGRLPVNNTWSIGGAGLPHFSGWQAIRILDPAPAESGPARFTVQCAGSAS